MICDPPGIGLGLWMTLLSSNKRPINNLFLEHINNIDPAIKFTVEDNQGNGVTPFFTPWSCQRQTIPYLFLYIENPPILTSTCSHHNLVAKYSVIGTLTYRAKQSVLDLSSVIRKYNTLGKLYPSVNTIYVPWIWSKVSF